MTKMHQVRKEYSESFCEVVKGYAEQGNSRVLTASTLGINLSYFRELCTRFGLHKHFKPKSEMRRECRPRGGKGWPKGQPRGAQQVIQHNGRVWKRGEPTFHYLAARVGRGI